MWSREEGPVMRYPAYSAQGSPHSRSIQPNSDSVEKLCSNLNLFIYPQEKKALFFHSGIYLILGHSWAYEAFCNTWSFNWFSDIPMIIAIHVWFFPTAFELKEEWIIEGGQYLV